MHVNYDVSNTDFDIALIKLKEPVDLSLPHINTICLPTNDKKSYIGKTATVTGWGMTSYSGKTSNVLRKVSNRKPPAQCYVYNKYN